MPKVGAVCTPNCWIEVKYWQVYNRYGITSVAYLGYRIDKKGLHPTDKKTSAIKEAPFPINALCAKIPSKVFKLKEIRENS